MQGNGSELKKRYFGGDTKIFIMYFGRESRPHKQTASELGKQRCDLN